MRPCSVWKNLNNVEQEKIGDENTRVPISGFLKYIVSVNIVLFYVKILVIPLRYTNIL